MDPGRVPRRRRVLRHQRLPHHDAARSRSGSSSGAIDRPHFWLRRARRLLPALFAVILATVAYTVLVLSDEVARLRGDVVAALTYTTNWFLIFSKQSYFEAAGRPSPLRHLWSLAVEEQFYILWPILFGLMLRKVKGQVDRLFLPLVIGRAGQRLLDGLALRPRRRPVARLLRHRHQGGGHPPRRRAGLHLDAVAFAPRRGGQGGAAPRGRPAGWPCCSSCGASPTPASSTTGCTAAASSSWRWPRSSPSPSWCTRRCGCSQRRALGGAGHLGGAALVRALPLALARLRVHDGRRDGVRRLPAARGQVRRHLPARRAELPVRGDADPPQRAGTGQALPARRRRQPQGAGRLVDRAGARRSRARRDAHRRPGQRPHHQPVRPGRRAALERCRPYDGPGRPDAVTAARRRPRSRGRRHASSSWATRSA